MIKPDYAGGGIVNLMSSLMQARGASSALPDARLLPASALAEHRHLVLMVIDGLGAKWLLDHSPNGLLSQHMIGHLTSVFPSTTAAAIGSFLTGEPPAQHGLTGWFTWLRELGCVMKVLPGQPRCGGQGDWKLVPDLRALFPCPPLFERIATASTMISPHTIANSAFNRAYLGPAKLRTFADLQGYFHQIEAAVKRTREPSYIYAYWPELDHIGHEQGITSQAALDHLQAIEAGLASLLERLGGQDLCLLVTADHGQLDTTEADLTDLADHPALAQRLRVPLCGEPRAAFCYAGAAEADGFLAAARAELGDRFEVFPSRDLLEQGFFGPGPAEAFPELTHRIGDVTVIGRGQQVIRDRLVTETAFRQVGVHGGLSPAEMLVPLCRMEP